MSDNERAPFFAITAAELDRAPRVGEVVKCHRCEAYHEVQTSVGKAPNGEAGSVSLQWFNCPVTDQTFMVGINGKSVRGGTLP